MRNLIKLLLPVLVCPSLRAVAVPGPGRHTLPIHITLFSASYDSRKDVVSLRWITGAVENGDQFLVERSADSIHFVRVGETKSGITSKTPQHYYFDDPKPLSGKLYYRLHLLGADGSDSYTTVTSVYKEIVKMELSDITRDTATKTIYFSIASPRESNANITLVDYTGKVLKSYFIPLKKGSNFQSAYIGNFSPGIYFLQINDKNGGGSVMQQFSRD